MTPLELERAVRAFIAAGTDLTLREVRQANTKFDPPKTLYVTVLSNLNVRRGYPNYHQGDADEGVAISTPRAAEFSVQFYRDQAYYRAVEFAEWCESQIGLEAAISRGFAIDWDEIADASLTVLRLDERVAEVVEQRGQIDLPVIYNSERVEMPERIETVTGEVVVAVGSATQTLPVDGAVAP